jgi:hypothetical protein
MNWISRYKILVFDLHHYAKYVSSKLLCFMTQYFSQVGQCRLKSIRSLFSNHVLGQS